MSCRPLRHTMDSSCPSRQDASSNLLTRVRQSFRRSFRRQSVRIRGAWRDSRRKPVFVSPDLKKPAPQVDLDSASASSSSSSPPGTKKAGLWKTIIGLFFVFLLHNLALVLTIINFKATNPLYPPPNCNESTGTIFLNGFEAVSEETKIEASPTLFLNNVWIGLGLLQNIWIGYSLLGIFRWTDEGRFTEHIGFPSLALCSSYLHAVFAILFFLFLFDRKFLIAACGALVVTAFYAFLTLVTMIRDLHRAEDALSFSYPLDLKMAPLLLFPLAAYSTWISISAVHLFAVVCVNVWDWDDELVSIVTACIITIGNLVFLIVDVKKFDLYTRRILGPYLIFAAFLIGGVVNHVPLREPSKFVLIGCSMVSLFIIFARCALMCYRNKRRKRANIQMLNNIMGQVRF